ncbi:MAG: hypothetical protein IJT27_01675 [Clostridia bacterium]|nr:hypothetical protein [Clostridia bacterium]
MQEILDLHVYTNNSPCGKDKVSFLCETAVERGIRAVAFTDICGIDTIEELDTRRRMRHAFYDTAKARQLFFNALSVFSGIEFEQAYQNPALAAEMMNKRAYDIVLSAVTAFADQTPFGLDRTTSPAAFASFARQYAACLLQTVETTDFDVLSRLLAPLRNLSSDLAVFEEAVKPALRALAEKEKALEVDTVDLLGSERLRDLYMRLIGFFKDCGGKYLVVGSESKCFDQLGNGIEIACAAVRRTGFDHVCFYDRRIPYTVEL